MKNIIFGIFVLAVVLFVSGCTEDPQFAKTVNIEDVFSGGGVETPKYSCTDSDGGFNLYERGTCIDSLGRNLTDECIDPQDNYGKTLKESYCYNNTCVVESDCPFSCLDGICITNHTGSEYQYIIEFENQTAINNNLTSDVIIYKALRSDGKGFYVISNLGNIETSKILAVKPDTTLANLPKFFYENDEGENIEFLPANIYVQPNQEPLAVLRYTGSTGMLKIAQVPHSEIDFEEVMFELIANEEDQDGFMNLGRYKETAEYQEIYSCGFGYVGLFDYDLWITNYFVIQNPHENSEIDQIKFSFFD